MPDVISNTAGDPTPTAPSGPVGQLAQKTINPLEWVAKVNREFAAYRTLKRPIEVSWYIAQAFTRGVSDVRWNDVTATLEQRQIPQHKRGYSINKILPKVRKRKADYLKPKYQPTILPATSDKEDKMNAVATEKALQYVARKRGLRKVYREMLNWPITCSKGFISLFWDATKEIMISDPLTGKAIGAQRGDVIFDSMSPFEIFIPDLGVERLAKQAKFIRARAMPLDEVKRLFSDCPDIGRLGGDSSSEDVSQYQKQIAALANKGNIGVVSNSGTSAVDRELKFVIVKEHFCRPTSEWPKGTYAVVAKDMLLKFQDFLPYGFHDMDNPYPIVEFADIELAGQFWGTCIVDQLINPQREYNELRRGLRDHLEKMKHPKVIVSVFAKWPENAWNSEAGEVIRIVTPPGMMEPKIITPPQIASDLWRNLEVLRSEIDELSVSTAALGEQGSTTSGFQVNILNEASSAVNAPDIEGHELAFQDLYLKTRRMMKTGYTKPLLINAVGRNHVQDVIEFSSDQIDENAEIIIYTGSTLSDSPAIRTQQVVELWNNGLIKDENNLAESQRKALTMLDADGIGEFQEEQRRDEEKARLENMNIGKGNHVKPPLPMDNHLIHIGQHKDQIVSPEFDMWDDVKQKELFVHYLLHMKWVNPAQSIQTALELGLTDIIPLLYPAQMPPQLGMQLGLQGGDQTANAEVPPPPAA